MNFGIWFHLALLIGCITVPVAIWKDEKSKNEAAGINDSITAPIGVGVFLFIVAEAFNLTMVLIFD